MVWCAVDDVLRRLLLLKDELVGCSLENWLGSCGCCRDRLCFVCFDVGAEGEQIALDFLIIDDMLDSEHFDWFCLSNY